MPNFYKVGGCVRDVLLGREPKDIDYVVVGSTSSEMLSSGFELVGNDFPVFLKDGQEYALARREKSTGTGYRDFSIDFGPEVTLEEDLLRRDLTINAMAMDSDGNIIDPYNGQEDLKRKVLRCVSPSAFKEDPVRVLRLARFAARYPDFTIAPETLGSAVEASSTFGNISGDRIYKEFIRAMGERCPFNFMETLRVTKHIRPVFGRDFLFYSHLENIKNDCELALIALFSFIPIDDREFIKSKLPFSRKENMLIDNAANFYCTFRDCNSVNVDRSVKTLSSIKHNYEPFVRFACSMRESNGLKISEEDFMLLCGAIKNTKLSFLLTEAEIERVPAKNRSRIVTLLQTIEFIKAWP